MTQPLEPEFIDMAAWNRCLSAPADVTGVRSIAGFSCGRANQAALAFYFPVRKLVLAFFWMTRNAKTWLQKEGVAVEDWQRDGNLRIYEGQSLPPAMLQDIQGLCKDYKAQTIAVDRWLAPSIAEQLAAAGLSVTAVPQNMHSLAGPSQELERLVLSGDLTHEDDPILRWHIANCGRREDPAGNYMPRRREDTQSIDGCLALLMAMSVAMAKDETHRTSAQPDLSALRVLDGALTKLQLDPGDIVVFMADKILSLPALERIQADLKQLCPGHEVIVLEKGCRLGAIGLAQTIPALDNAIMQRLWKEWQDAQSEKKS